MLFIARISPLEERDRGSEVQLAEVERLPPWEWASGGGEVGGRWSVEMRQSQTAATWEWDAPRGVAVWGNGRGVTESVTFTVTRA